MLSAVPAVAGNEGFRIGLTLTAFGFDFPFTQSWNPVTEKFGALAPAFSKVWPAMLVTIASASAVQYSFIPAPLLPGWRSAAWQGYRVAARPALVLGRLV